MPLPFLTKVDRVNSLLTYTGYAAADSDTSDPVWQISRTVTSGGLTTTEYAGNGEFSQIWDNRTTLFPTPIFDNNYSVNFNGINNLLSFGDVFTALDVGTQWSMSFWCYIDNVASQRCIYSKCTNDVNVYGFNIQITTSSKVFIQFRSASYSVNYTGLISVSTGNWVNLVVTYNGGNNANGMRVYVNAILDQLPASVSLGATLHQGQTAMFGSRNASTNPYSGYIDEVTFWNKALTSTEVIELYNSGSPLSPLDHSASANAIHWWRMGDGDAFPTIVDNIGSSNGTLTNMISSQITPFVP